MVKIALNFGNSKQIGAQLSKYWQLIKNKGNDQYCK